MHPLAKLRTLAHRLSGTLWFLPSLGVVTAIVLGTVLSRVQVPGGARITSVLYAGDAAGARGLLEAIAGSMISVTGVTFSLTVVALQLASAQYSPRLLQNFLHDRGNKSVLTGFLSTFGYAIAVLRTIGTTTSTQIVPVPALAVTVGIALTLMSLGLLVYFVNHLAQSIRVESIIERARVATLEAVEGQLAGEQEHRIIGDPPAVPSRAVAVAARRSGYLRFVEFDGLNAQARSRGVTVWLEPWVGDHVVEGGVVAWVWPDDDGQRISSDAFEEMVDASLFVGADRTITQDVGLGIRQLADIAVKALSPGVNDPTSAVQTLTALTVVFARLARHPVGHHTRRDEETGHIRVLVRDAPLRRYLPVVAGQIRRFGSDQPEVLLQLLQLLADVGAQADREEDRELALEQIRLVRAAAGRGLDETADLAMVEEVADAASRRARDGGRAYPVSAA